MYCLCLAFALLYICLPLSWLCLSPCLYLLFVFSSLRLSWLSLCPCLCLVFSCLVLSLSCLVCSLCRLGGRVGSFLVVLGVFWGHFLSSWGSFGALGVVLGRSLGVLEALGAVLGRVDAPKAAGPEILAALESIFGPNLGTKRSPRRSPKRPKIDPKIVLKNDRFFEWS